MNETKRPWWRKKRWAAIGITLLLIAYPASAGPLGFAVIRGWLPAGAAHFYTHNFQLAEAIGIGPMFNRYMGWWGTYAIAPSGYAEIQMSDGSTVYIGRLPEKNDR